MCLKDLGESLKLFLNKRKPLGCALKKSQDSLHPHLARGLRWLRLEMERQLLFL